MPRYYCDYCDTYLFVPDILLKLIRSRFFICSNLPSVRKQHNAGYKHKANVRTYYQQFEEQQTQSLIDQRIKEHLGLQQQVGVTFNQHLMTLPRAPQRPRLPVMPPPMLPVGAGAQPPVGAPLIPGVRPPVLPRPMMAPPGYGVAPTMPPQIALPPGTTSAAMLNNLPRPPILAPPTSGDVSAPVNPMIYQANPATATTSNFEAFNTSSGSGNN